MKNNKSLSPIRLVYMVSIAVSVLCILCFHPIEYNDTPSYLRAWDNLSHGELDTFRTPLYPAFLGVMKSLFGSVWKWVAVVIQYAIFLLSVKYFHRIASSLLKEKAALIVTAFYAIYPTFNSWSNILQTESFCLSLSVFFVYASLKAIMEGSVKHSLIMTLLLFLLLALRPSNVCLFVPAGISFFLMLFNKDKRIAGIVSLAGVAVCCICLLFYSGRIKEKTGVFTPSVVSVYNQLTIARMYGYLQPEAAEDAHHVEVLRNNYEKYGAEVEEGPDLYYVLGDLWNEFTVSEMKHVVDNSIRQKPILWAQALVKRAYFALLTPATRSYTSNLFRLHPLFPVNIGIVTILLLVYSVLIIILLFKRQLPGAGIFLVILSFCVIGTSIVGAQYEFARLILPAIPCVLLMIAQLCQMVTTVPGSVMSDIV